MPLICEQCGAACAPQPFFYKETNQWFNAPLYFYKPNQSKADFAGEAGRHDFCSVACCYAYMAPRAYERKAA